MDNPTKEVPAEEVPVEEASKVVEKTKPAFRWKMGAAILLLAVLAVILSKVYLSDSTTLQSFTYYPITLGTVGLLLIWWFVFSGLSMKSKFKGFLGAVLVLVMFNVLFKFDRFTGDVLPSYSFRFSSAKSVDEFVERQAVDKELVQQTLTVQPGDWPEFRGPKRDGIVKGLGLNPDWENSPPKELWRHPIGMGWSSFVVVGNHVFTQELRGTITNPAESVICYDLETGDQIWAHSDPVWFTEPLGGDGPRATPTFFDSKIYAMGAAGQLNCLDASTGKKIWGRNILEDASAKNLMWAMSASPLVYGDFVVTNPGIGPDKAGKSVIKYNRHTGEIVWSAGDRAASYVGPVLKTIEGVEQLVVFDGEGLTSHDEQTGEELWHFPWTNSPKVNSAIPHFFEDGSIFFSAAYGSGSARVKPVLKEDGNWAAPEEIWTSKNVFRLKFNDAIVQGDYTYGLDDSVLACLDLNTGKRKWKKGRYGYGQLIQVDDYLLILSEAGEIVLTEFSPKGMKELAKIPAISGITWNHPTLVGNKLLIRNAQEVACYELPLLNK